MADEELLYDDRHIAFFKDIWGEGFLSPGGAEEASRVVDGLDLAGKRVLDIGCGSGAVSVLLVSEFGAAQVVGIDVEDDVCNAARRLVAQEGVEDRVTIDKVVPGPLGFPDQSFDVVYSKDSIIHIPDKEALCSDVFRVLKPGGWFAVSDWLISHDGEPSDEMKAYIVAEDLEFAMASPERYKNAFNQTGFINVKLTNRNSWYREVAQHELDFLTGPKRPRLDRQHGSDLIATMVDTWQKMTVVLNSGEHCPHHLRGQRPAWGKR